jgi:hypothetical protein
MRNAGGGVPCSFAVSRTNTSLQKISWLARLDAIAALLFFLQPSGAALGQESRAFNSSLGDVCHQLPSAAEGVSRSQDGLPASPNPFPEQRYEY